MPRFYEVKEEPSNLTSEEAESGRSLWRAFQGTRGLAKAQGREWAGVKSLRPGCGVEVVEHNVIGGKPGLLAWLNEHVGNAPAPAKVAGKKAAAKKRR